MGLLADADELYRLYQRAVHAYALRLTDDPDRAEDFLQETFYRAIRGAGASGVRLPL